jgi:hypothetical protein
MRVTTSKTDVLPEASAELKAVIRDAEESSFRPESWYPPAARCSDEPHPHATIAYTPGQAKILASSGWQPSAEFFRPQMEREAIEASRQRALVAEKALEDERRASEVQAALESEKAQRSTPTPAQVAETIQQFLVRAHQARVTPISDRIRKIHDEQVNVCDRFSELRNHSWGAAHNEAAKRGLALFEEEQGLKAKLVLLEAELAGAMTNAG